MKTISDRIIVIATSVIAVCAITNCILTWAIKTSSEKYQQKTNEILEESVRTIRIIESSKTKRKLQKELDEELQKVNPQRKFNTGR